MSLQKADKLHSESQKERKIFRETNFLKVFRLYKTNIVLTKLPKIFDHCFRGKYAKNNSLGFFFLLQWYSASVKGCFDNTSWFFFIRTLGTSRSKHKNDEKLPKIGKKHFVPKKFYRTRRVSLDNRAEFVLLKGINFTLKVT